MISLLSLVLCRTDAFGPSQSKISFIPFGVLFDGFCGGVAGGRPPVGGRGDTIGGGAATGAPLALKLAGETTWNRAALRLT